MSDFTTATDAFTAQGSSNPSLKFAAIGDTHAGIVTEVVERNDAEPDGTLRTWPDGNPKRVYVFTLEDNGDKSSLWVRGAMVSAIREAVKTAGVSTLIGTKLTVQHHALGEAKKGLNAPKLYRARVETVTAPAIDTTSPF
jgi:hypothetical protein